MRSWKPGTGLMKILTDIVEVFSFTVTGIMLLGVVGMIVTAIIRDQRNR